MNILFLSGREYYHSIKLKEQTQRTWYEKLYMLYFENFKTILLVIACLILYKFISLQYYGNYSCKNSKQLGGFKYVRTAMLDKTKRNIEKTKSAIKTPFKSESYKTLGSSVKSGLSSGYSKAKELGSAGLEYGKGGIAYGAEQFREKSEFIYKYIAMAFIGIGFTVYIFPVLAMFLIGALTFLIVRKNIANVITA